MNYGLHENIERKKRSDLWSNVSIAVKEPGNKEKSGHMKGVDKQKNRS